MSGCIALERGLQFGHCGSNRPIYAVSARHVNTDSFLTFKGKDRSD